ncbi:hypothetical protein D3C87_1732280 [compost metagenome]
MFYGIYKMDLRIQLAADGRDHLVHLRKAINAEQLLNFYSSTYCRFGEVVPYQVYNHYIF